MKNRKTLVLTVIAIVTLSLLVIGATFAYFGANNSASGSTTVTTKNETIGSVIVTNPTENLYLKMSSYDMQEANKGTSYYATEDSSVSHSKGKENNVIAKYTISGGEQSTVYNCSFNMSVNKPSDIQEGDMTLKLTGLGAKINGLSSISIDLANADSTYQVKFNRVGNGIGNLVVGDITFNNTETEQNYLESKTLNTSVTLSGMECSIEETEEPDLFEGTLTPVVYDGNNWKIVESTDKEWYDYENQEWANAVILKSDSTKGVGDTVLVEGDNPDVLAMYVWIPRYEYKIEGRYGLGGTSASSPGEIEVNFISKDTTVPSDGYMIHPAFTFGGEELSGIWVAKFEISHTSLSSSTTINNLTCTDVVCENANGLRILPNNRSLRYNNISNFYYGIKSMEQEDNVFGINGDTTDSHMIKNSEWGAVAYLTQSTYGKYGNKNYSGKDKVVYLNNSSDYLTGRSAGTYGSNASISTEGSCTYDGYLYDGITYTYERDMSKIGSTTGNITGIYDMAGGTWEYVMGVYANSNGELWTGYSTSANSGFTGKVGASGVNYSGTSFPNKKYYDEYTAYSGTSISSLTSCNNGVCYGHDLDETARWYDGLFYFVSASEPWFVRGGSYGNGNNTNVFLASTAYGRATEYSTRSVLTSKSTLSKEYKTYKNGEVVYFDVETGLKCTNYNEENSKTGYNGIDNRTGNQNSCLKFYAFNDAGGSTVNLILDHNTTATTVWNSSDNSSDGPNEVIEHLKQDTKDWKGTIEPSNYTTGISGREYTVNYEGYKARLITANEIATISGNIGYNENKNSENLSFFFDTGIDAQSPLCIQGNTTGCMHGWLYDRSSTTCTKEGCLNNSDVETSGYWSISSNPGLSDSQTHTSCNYEVVYGISRHGRLGYTCPNYKDHYGVRPVIEIPKNGLYSNYSASICTYDETSEVSKGNFGAKYNCKVDPNKDVYTFYLIDNNTDGTSDLIMSHNINASGEAVISGVTSDTGSVAWFASADDNTYGPVTAMEYLYNATKNWTNVEPVNFTYNDKEVQASKYGYRSFVSTNGIATITAADGTISGTIGTSTKPLRTRMPVYTRNTTYSNLNEIKSLYQYVNQFDEFYCDNIYHDSDMNNKPYGYWTLSSYSGEYYTIKEAWSVDGYCYMSSVLMNVSYGSAYVGVRPVINVRL